MHVCTHAHARNLPSPEALSPEIEVGAVKRRPLQLLFLLPLGGARPATGPGAISSQNLRNMLQWLVSWKIKAIGHRHQTPDQPRLDKKNKDKTATLDAPPLYHFREGPRCSSSGNHLQIITF